MNPDKLPTEVNKHSAKAELALKRFLHLSLDLFCITGENGYFQQLNPAWEYVLGWSISELQHTAWIERVHPDDVEVTLSSERQCLPQDVVEYENRYRHKDGSYHWLSWRVSRAEDGFFYRVGKDITSEIKLRESERRFRAVFNQTFQFCSLLTPDGRVIEDNQIAMDFCQLKREEIIGFPFSDIHCWTISPETQERLRRAIAQAAAGNVVRYEVDILAPDNSVITIDFSLKPMKDESGNVELLIAEGRDITARKQAETALKESEERFRCLSQCSPVGIFLTDVEGGCIYANPRLLTLTGLTFEEIVGGGWKRVVHPDDREWVVAEWGEYARHGQECHHEYRFLTPQGIVRWIQVRTSPMHGDHRRLMGHVGTVEDITERKQAEEALRLSEKRYSLAVSAAKIGVWDWNLETNDIYVDPSLKAMLGYEDDEIQNHIDTWGQLVHPDDREQVMAVANAHLEGVTPQYEIEHRMLHKDGSIRWFLACGTAIRDTNGRAIRMMGTDSDITERKQAEAELRKAYQQLTLHVDNSPLAILEWDHEFRLQRWSKQAEKIFGWKATELLNQHPWDWRFIYGEDAEMINVILHQLMDGTIDRTVDENRNYAKDGRIIDCEWYNSTLRDESGTLVSILSLVLDVTERKQAEAALQQVMSELETRVEERTAQLKQANEQLQAEIAERQRTETSLLQSEEQFRRVFDEAPIGMALAGLDNRYIRVNRAFYEMLGYAEDELMALSFLDITHPDDLELEIPFMEQLVQGEIDSFDLEKRYRNKNQEIVWVNLTLIGLRDQAGAVLYTLAMLQNITERKQAVEALRQSEARYRAIIEDQTELICRFKPDGTLIFVNDAYCRYFSKQRSELIGHSFRPVIPQEDQELLAQSLDSLSQEQPISTCEHRVILPSGEIRTQQWTNRAVMFDEQGKVIEFQAAGRDITELKQAEAEILKALEKERELSELRSSFVSLVSHEFRTPLTTIQSSAELLERYEHKLSGEKKHNHYRRIQNAVQRMTQLLEDVLTIGKAEAGKLQFTPSPMDLVAFCHELVEGLQMSAQPRHHIKFVVVGEGSDAHMDEKLLSHILTNLLTNALKYSPDGGVVQFELVCDRPKGDRSWVVFRIQDQGIGIPPEDLERLFESFGRASNVGTIPGTGLGLAIVKKCVDLHRGKITVKSEIGIGTTFTVTLPLKSEPSSPQH